ncbi:IucA/IucC family protein [Macrococcus carouselicus]|nr:IucA/IucC family protein [Macrococcus carouselicus]
MRMNKKQLSRFAGVHFPDLTPALIDEAYDRAEVRIRRLLSEALLNEAVDLDAVSLEARSRLTEELEDCINNLTLSYLQYERDCLRYKGQYQSIFDYYHTEEQDASLFEQCCYEGHPFHPMSKTKLGFTAGQVLQFAPEFKQQTAVMTVYIHQDLMKSEGLLNLAAAEAPPGYGVVYVHDWQWGHVITSNYQTLIDEGLIRLGAPVQAAPLLSFRSLLTPEAVIKTAVSVQATSAVRNVSRSSIENGIRLGRYVDDYYRRHQYKGCYIQKDVYGSWFHQEDSDPQFACLIRERIAEDSAVPVVAASLINRSFVTGELIMTDCIGARSAHDFMRRYTQLLMTATYRLMIETGISLEAHMQNTVIAVEKGLPVAVYIRDFGGIRVLNDDVPINDATNIRAANEADLFNVMSHAVIYNHLLQIYRAAADAGLIDYNNCLLILEDVVTDIHQQAEPSEALDLFRQPTLKVKALLKMRLMADARDYNYIEVKNPLYKEVL